MSNQLPQIERVIVWCEPKYVERFSPCVFPCPLLPCTSCLQPCEQENTYVVMNSDENWQQWGQILYKISESCNFTQLCICPPSRRTLTLIGKNRNDETRITSNKPMRCPIFCLSRPEITVEYREQYIGKVIENCQLSILACQFHEVKIYDKNNAVIFIVSASICQLGLCFMLPCSMCREIKYFIKTRDGQVVGEIVHLFGGFRQECCSKGDTYGVRFPVFATVEEKILIIQAVIFIDYQQFDNF